jgi:chromosome segregation ATPase
MIEVEKTEQREQELRRELHEVEQRDERLSDELRAGERREGELIEQLHEIEEREEVEVEVAFPLATEPYRHRLPRHELAGQAMRAAMQQFGVADDQTTKYELYHKGNLVNLNETLGAIAERTDEVKFTLSKEIVQG